MFALLLLCVVDISAWTATKVPDVTVLNVTDGDTIRVQFRGMEEPVRLLYVDTPESKDNHHGPATREGVIAKETVEKWLPQGSRVTLWTPHSDFRRDPYKRLLAVVLFDGDGEDSVQKRLISGGLSVYWQKYNKPGDPPDWLHQDLLQCQEAARSMMRGFWAVIPDWMAQKALEQKGDPIEDAIQATYGFNFVPDVNLALSYLEKSARGKSINQFQQEYAGPVTIPTLSLMVACYDERQALRRGVVQKIYPGSFKKCEELLKSAKHLTNSVPKEAQESLNDFVTLGTGMLANIGKYGQPSKGSWEKLDKNLAQLAKLSEPGQRLELIDAFVVASATARALRFCTVARLGGDIPQVVP